MQQGRCLPLCRSLPTVSKQRHDLTYYKCFMARQQCERGHNGCTRPRPNALEAVRPLVQPYGSNADCAALVLRNGLSYQDDISVLWTHGHCKGVAAGQCVPAATLQVFQVMRGSVVNDDPLIPSPSARQAFWLQPQGMCYWQRIQSASVSNS